MMEANTGRTGLVLRTLLGYRTTALAVLFVGGLLAEPGSLSGQAGAYAFQIRAGGTQPVASFRDDSRGWTEGAGKGTSLGMGFTFPLYRFMGGYLGFSQHRFACDSDVCPGEKPWISTGFDFALRVVLGSGAVRPWAQAGFHSHRLEGRILVAGESQEIRSEGGGGYELGGGVLVKVAERMSLSPGVRYGLGNVPFETRPSIGLRFLVFDLGLVVGF